MHTATAMWHADPTATSVQGRAGSSHAQQADAGHLQGAQGGTPLSSDLSEAWHRVRGFRCGGCARRS